MHFHRHRIKMGKIGDGGRMLFVLARLLNRVRAEEEEEGTLTGRKRPDADARSNISSRVYVDQREDRNDRRYILRFFFFFFSFLYLSPLIYFFHSQSGSSSGVGRVSGRRFLVSSPSLSLSFSLECIYKIYSIVVTAQIKYSSSNNNRDKKKKKKKSSHASLPTSFGYKKVNWHLSARVCWPRAVDIRRNKNKTQNSGWKSPQ